MKLVGIIGAIGSGKDTSAEVLIGERGFKKLSFAGKVKDVAAVVFGWDRDMLEGVTAASREWREKVDEHWGLSPRTALQKIGTEMFRVHIRDDIWVKALETQVAACHAGGTPVVITDCRFANEVASIKAQGGMIIHVERGSPPAWLLELQKKGISVSASTTPPMEHLQALGVHVTEWNAFALKELADVHIRNNGSIKELEEQVLACIA